MDLAVLWFWIVAFFFIGYFVLDGFDFGVGMSLPFLGRDDTDRRVLINTIGPVWDLNETWVIVAGAALFAAFPEWYATLFSGFYLPLLLILLALIARGVSFEYRHQRPEAQWKRRFDTMIVVGSAVPAFLWGVAFANIVQGVPMDADHNFTGTVLDLLNPYALLGGATTLLLFFTHGVVFVALKTEGGIRERARRLATRAGLLTVVVAAVFLAWTNLGQGSTASWALSAGAAATLVGGWLAITRGREGRAFALLAGTIALAVLALFATLFPAVMPASNVPAYGLTIENASSTPYTLTVMSWTALVFVPLIVGYQAWTYWIFRKRISRAHIPVDAH
ncbi:cytochrome d ubiquinol oxidase subunit II [Rathayibacter sp. AY1G1]|jgi:cytochrome d ubiquinol oxidase subunit II|uniref:cytochrome d ubiquinol oxidase subunit II n=1 Tax=unclassified Rathayibacter TaxID=2609250 RepID=UPI000CE89D6E|nr:MULTISPECIES: cytochrome d ubiquinol oxidase subunit II [unclassified Rathayibacter]PPF49081.1 cytochrome d ubiquinol oxidase subunit II [Rathayibacter sp. AY1A1]PPG34920.1 cytochrome d ubiquinol oxidase subunit II [Rathayibacter sp. AY2B9]PPG44918.1 cytochrome d ubiquinol oxidase subunit II [Rathayibacter sp. AY2B5]PPG86683.1 cytochrome d ubiquinol oxidase subunit II [Rathayibacter sp. AY1H2]PPH00182.1 cytochrome d ubiquinol oxidase subunit II [Rathayibacter sp. AY1G9]